MKLKIFITVIFLNVVALAQTIFWDYSEKLYGESTSIITVPVSKMDKNKPFRMGINCRNKNAKFIKYYRIRTKIWQENPCLALDPNEVKYKIIDKHTVIVDLKDENDGYYTIGDEYEVVQGKKFNSHYKTVLGKDNCELKGKEKWDIYYLDNGKWKYGCSGVFIYK